MAKETKLTLKEARILTMRGYKIWWQENPAIFISVLLHNTVLGITPYVAIFFTSRIIDEIAGMQNRVALRNLVLMTLASALILGLLIAILNRWKSTYMSTIWRRQEAILNKKMLSMDFMSVDDSRIQDLRSQITQNTMWQSWGLLRLVHIFESVTRGLVISIGGITLTAGFFTATVPEEAGRLTILNSPLSTGLIIFIMLVAIFLAPVLTSKAENRSVKFAGEMKFINRYFNYIHTMTDSAKRLDVRMYQQNKMINEVRKRAGRFSDRGLGKDWVFGWASVIMTLSEAVTQAFIGIVYLVVGLKAWAGAFGIGLATQYIASITALSKGISTLVEALGELKNNAEFLRTTFEYLDEPNHMYQGSLTVEKREDNKYEIEFRKVSFKYPTVDTYALKDVTLSFRVGERLAIVGENGSGKTTFIKLLCRLYDPTEGEILLNGIDIRKYDYHEYMDIFSVVFQDFKLLAFGLGENVAAGVDYDKVFARECLEGAGFGERLATWEYGLETNLYKDFDDKGVEVSGGEAQKIALARALYKDAAFIILDEPTAALDPIAEHEVYSRMNEITEGKTAIFISHRLSSCRFCQDIVVFDEGELIQQGNHDELVAEVDGKYHELWHAQAQYYVD